ncbi:MAG: pilus assembly protein [Alphaproteobacteria bacterium]|nr:pilus assembly protein [Alphaproteobacteria bacterium]
MALGAAWQVASNQTTKTESVALGEAVKDRHGNVAVEFAMILPITVLMLAGLVDFGLVTDTRTALENGARAGAMFALFESFDLSNIQNTVIASTDLRLVIFDIDAGVFYECDGAWSTAVAAGTACAGGTPRATFVNGTETPTYTPFFPLVDLILPTELPGPGAAGTP